jgi:hypothetical protein
MFGHVDSLFGKHSSGPRSLQESRGEAARRALRWIDRLGMLPRNGLDHGLAGSSTSSNPASGQSVFGTAGAHHFQTSTNFNHGLVSTNSSHQSLSWSPPNTGVRTLPQDIHSETSLGFKHSSHQAPQPVPGPNSASSMKKSRKQARKPSKVLRQSKDKLWSGGPISSAANMIPLKRRRITENPTFSTNEPATPVLTKQGLLSRMSFHKEHVNRVAGKKSLLEAH